MSDTLVKLYGPLRDKYGSDFELNGANSIAEVIDALSSNFKNFRVDILKTKEYNIFIDDRSLGIDELTLEKIDQKTIKIVPLVVGASGKEMTIGKIVLGVALVALSFAIPPASGMILGAISSGLLNVGIGLVLSGFADLIFGPPEDDPEDEQSYLFNGAVNISKQGAPVPIGYGRLKVGSTNISNKLRNYSNIGGEATSANYSTEYASILDCISEGPIQGVVGGKDGIYLNDVPLTENGKINIKNINADFRIGTRDQSYMSGFSTASRVRALSREVTHGYKIDGVIVPEQIPVERVIGPNTDAVIITLFWPGGLFNTDLKDPAVHRDECEFRLEYTSGSNKTWRDIPERYMNQVKDLYSYTSTFKVGEYQTITLDKTSTGAITSTNRSLGAVLSLEWYRIVDFYQEAYHAKAGSIDSNPYDSYIFADTYITLKVEYREIGTSSWLVYDNNLTLSSDKNYIDREPKTGPITYFDIEISLTENKSWEYRVTLVDTDVMSKTVFDVFNNPSIMETKIAIKPNFMSVTKGVTGITSPAGKIKSSFKNDYYFKLPILSSGKVDFPIDIRIRRVDKDDVAENENNEDNEITSTFQWSALTEIVEQKFTYPNTALVGLNFNAKDYDSLPQRAYLVELLLIKVPVNYNGRDRTTNGFWNGDFKVEWTDNPAWVFYDMVTNDRYGMGQYLGTANVNKWMLYEVAKFCDERLTNYTGGTEPRYSINTYITKQDDALIFMRHFASVFRGMVYWMENKLTVTYDHPSDSVCMFSNSNVIDGSFSYTGAARDTRYNVVYVNWTDPTIDYKTSIEYVEDTKDIANRNGQIVAKDLTALGCSSRAQAYRFGRALMATERETVTFSCSFDNVGGKPGDLAEIHDKYRSNVRHSGRVKNIEGNTLYLDGDSLDIKSGESYTIKLISRSAQEETLENGTTIKSVLPKIHSYQFSSSDYNSQQRYIHITSRNEEGNTLSNTNDIPNNTIWSITTTKIQAQIFRIISIIEKEKNIFSIDALAYNMDKQAWIDDPIATSLEPIPAFPPYFDYDFSSPDSVYKIIHVGIQETVKSYMGARTNFISISWDKSPGLAIKEFLVSYKYSTSSSGGSWQDAGIVSDSSYIELDPNFSAGWYTGRVTAILHNGAVMPSVESETRYMVAKEYPPKDITNFRFGLLPNSILRLYWDKCVDFDFSHYEIQNGISGCSWGDSGNRIFTDIHTNTIDLLDNFEVDFLIRAVDNSGIKSVKYSKITVIFNPSHLYDINGNFLHYGYRLYWKLDEGFYGIDYTEIREGATYNGSKLVRHSHDVEIGTTDLTNWSDSAIPNDIHNYWLIPVDKRGNRGKIYKYSNKIWPNYLENVEIIPEHLRVDIYFTRIDFGYNYRLDNKKSGYRFKTDYVELKSTNTGNNNVLTYRIYGEYFSIREMSAGNYTYDFTPYDIAGRRGETWNSGIVKITDGGIVTKMFEHIKFNGIFDRVYYNPNRGWLTGPLVSGETWKTHFSLFTRGYSNIQDQIDAGFQTYLIPGLNASNNKAVYSENYKPDTTITVTVDLIISVHGFGDGELKIYGVPKKGTTPVNLSSPRINANITSSITPKTVLDIYETYFRLRIPASTGGFDSVDVNYQFISRNDDGIREGLFTITEAQIIAEVV